jgi:hypothetical protein
MKGAGTLLLCVLLTQSFAQSSGQLGLTDDAALKLGYQRYFDAYTKKHGDSTAAMVQAQSSYAAIERRRNDRLIKPKSPAQKKQIAQLRLDLNTIATSWISATELVAGGGTMWQLVYAAIPHSIEEIVYGILTKQAKTASPKPVEDVRRAIEMGRTAMIDMESEDIRRALRMWDRHEPATERVLRLAKTLPAPDADRLKTFLIRFARVGEVN